MTEYYKDLPVGQIRRDGGTQARVGNNEETVEHYADAMRNGRWQWHQGNAVVVFLDDDNNHWLGDGFHRVEAAMRSFGSLTEVHALIRHGDRRQAILYAAGANADHGLRRSRDDVRRAITVLLRDGEWGRWSDAEIARQVHCSDKTVAKVRAELVASSDIPRIEERTVSRNGTTYSQSAPARPGSDLLANGGWVCVVCNRPQPKPSKGHVVPQSQTCTECTMLAIVQRGTARQADQAAHAADRRPANAPSPAERYQADQDARAADRRPADAPSPDDYENAVQAFAACGYALSCAARPDLQIGWPPYWLVDPKGRPRKIETWGGYRGVEAALMVITAPDDQDRHTAFYRRGIVPPIPDDQVPNDWDVWRDRADAAGLNLTIQTSIIDLRVGVGTDNILIRAGLSGWSDVQKMIEDQENGRARARNKNIVVGPYAHLKSCAGCGTTEYLLRPEGDDTTWLCESCMADRGLRFDLERLSPAERTRRLGGELECRQGKGSTTYALVFPGRADQVFGADLSVVCAALSLMEAEPTPVPADPEQVSPPAAPQPRNVIETHVENILAGLLQRLTPQEMRLMQLLIYGETHDGENECVSLDDNVWEGARIGIGDASAVDLEWVLGEGVTQLEA